MAPRSLPRQNADAVLMHAERYVRDAEALRPWSETAKECVDFFEDKQWSEEDLAALAQQNRPALTFNLILPLVNLVLGYFLNNRVDIKYLPGHDGSGTADMARVLSHVSKQVAELQQLPYKDAEIYLDGLLGGRAYYDTRLDFERNDFGEIRHKAIDPFSAYPDAENDSYDPNDGSHFTVSRWISTDEVEFQYGKQAAEIVRPMAAGNFDALQSALMYEAEDEVTPWRRFGGENEGVAGRYGWMNETLNSWVDTARKTIRMLDIQHYVYTQGTFFVDLVTGDRRLIPDHFGPARIEKVLAWAHSRNQPLIVQRRPHRRLRHTQLVGDIVLYDDWSMYERMTVTPWFPYFRRGKTRGMVESLRDPAREYNKRRSARLNTASRQSNGGWAVEKGSMDPEDLDALRNFGGRPGHILEYTRGKSGKLTAPEQIFPAPENQQQKALEEDAKKDLREIAGINEAALGQLEKVESGRAIEARQRQSVVGLEGFMTNFLRTRELLGRKQLELVQSYYTEERIVRVIGEGPNPTAEVINRRVAGRIINDVTQGRYAVAIDETPISKSFLEGQFTELLKLKELNVPIPDEFIVDASSQGRKEELKMAIAAQREIMAAQAAAGADPAAGQPDGQGPGPGGSQVGPDGGSLPPAEPGAPQMAAAE